MHEFLKTYNHNGPQTEEDGSLVFYINPNEDYEITHKEKDMHHDTVKLTIWQGNNEVVHVQGVKG